VAGWLPLRDLKKPMFKDTAKVRLEQLQIRLCRTEKSGQVYRSRSLLGGTSKVLPAQPSPT